MPFDIDVRDADFRRDPEWSKKSDRWIAETCGVSAPTVSSARKGSGVKDLHLPTTREGRDGKQQPATKPKRVTPTPEAEQSAVGAEQHGLETDRVMEPKGDFAW